MWECGRHAVHPSSKIYLDTLVAPYCTIYYLFRYQLYFSTRCHKIQIMAIRLNPTRIFTSSRYQAHVTGCAYKNDQWCEIFWEWLLRMGTYCWQILIYFTASQTSCQFGSRIDLVPFLSNRADRNNINININNRQLLKSPPYPPPPIRCVVNASSKIYLDIFVEPYCTCYLLFI